MREAGAPVTGKGARGTGTMPDPPVNVGATGTGIGLMSIGRLATVRDFRVPLDVLTGAFEDVTVGVTEFTGSVAESFLRGGTSPLVAAVFDGIPYVVGGTAAIAAALAF